MHTFIAILIGFAGGYLIGILLGAFTAFVLGFDDAARFIAIGCATLGAIIAPSLSNRFSG